MEEAINVERLVKDYLNRFHKHYKLPRHFDEEDELVKWCEDNLGIQYKDWTRYVGHVKDPHTTLSIVDPKWCTVFELRWAHLITGIIDRN